MLDEPLADGVLEPPLAAPPLAAPPVPEDEPLADGVLEPLAAPPEGVLLDPLALVEPPEAESFFAVSDEEALEEDDGLLGVAPALEEDDGVLGVAEPDAEPDAEPEPEGAVAEPDGVVVEPDEEDDAAPGLLAPLAARSPASSPHAVSKLAPKTMDTATAKVESLIDGPPWVGVRIGEQGSGP